jgi:hypothetical protein
MSEFLSLSARVRASVAVESNAIERYQNARRHLRELVAMRPQWQGDSIGDSRMRETIEIAIVEWRQAARFWKSMATEGAPL